MAIWLLPWGVLDVVVNEKKHKADVLGVQNSGATHLHSLAAGNGILLLGRKFRSFHVHVNPNCSEVLI